MSVRWPIEEQFGDETNYYLSPRVYHAIATRAIAALKEIATFRCTWANADPENCTCAGCVARRALRMEE